MRKLEQLSNPAMFAFYLKLLSFLTAAAVTNKLLYPLRRVTLYTMTYCIEELLRLPEISRSCVIFVRESALVLIKLSDGFQYVIISPWWSLLTCHFCQGEWLYLMLAQSYLDGGTHCGVL